MYMGLEFFFSDVTSTWKKVEINKGTDERKTSINSLLMYVLLWDANLFVLCLSQSLDAAKLWVKYEELTSALSQMLCEELRLILQPTQAAQLK